MSILIKILEGIGWLILLVVALGIGWGLSSDSMPEWYRKEMEDIDRKRKD